MRKVKLTNKDWQLVHSIIDEYKLLGVNSLYGNIAYNEFVHQCGVIGSDFYFNTYSIEFSGFISYIDNIDSEESFFLMSTQYNYGTLSFNDILVLKEIYIAFFGEIP